MHYVNFSQAMLMRMINNKYIIRLNPLLCLCVVSEFDKPDARASLPGYGPSPTPVGSTAELRKEGGKSPKKGAKKPDAKGSSGYVAPPPSRMVSTEQEEEEGARQRRASS